MDINSVSSNFTAAYNTANIKASSEEAAKTMEAEAKKTEVKVASKRKKTDTVEKTKYTQEQLNAIENIKNAEAQRTKSFNSMIQKMLGKQANLANITKDSFLNINITPVDIENAKKAIGEGGEYSVNSVADRIMDMAIALSGGDDSKLSELKAAVEKGFKLAEKQWGGKLPGICGDTYDEVMKRFDKWQNEGLSSIQ